jgi:hypothetical protein
VGEAPLSAWLPSRSEGRGRACGRARGEPTRAAVPIGLSAPLAHRHEGACCARHRPPLASRRAGRLQRVCTHTHTQTRNSEGALTAGRQKKTHLTNEKESERASVRVPQTPKRQLAGVERKGARCSLVGASVPLAQTLWPGRLLLVDGSSRSTYPSSWRPTAALTPMPWQ